MTDRVLALTLLLAAPAMADIPAAPVMTVYQFNGPAGVPYHDVASFGGGRTPPPAGTLAQGTSVIPCLVVRAGRPLTDADGTPYVGFEVVVDARTATPADAARFKAVAAARRALTVANHHCPTDTRHVVDARRLVALDKAPSFDPPRPALEPDAAPAGRGRRDAIVRAFHASPACEAANARLMGRRDALRWAWDAFAKANDGRWPADALRQARQLDFVMRTALYEGHLGRGCSAYGACERNVIALSIRNRAVERCLRGQGCRQPGDFEGVATAVSQYNIWDEYLTQTSGLTSCFLRPDLAAHPHYARLQAMYAQNAGDVERILFDGGAGLQALFPGLAPAQLARLRHYYHPPAMGKCFPREERLEYVSAAVARRGHDFALIANTRIRVDEAEGGGYRFRVADVEELPDRDVVRLADRYPGFVIDGRKIELRAPSGCTPYGTPRGCRFDAVGRRRKVPGWLADGDPLRLTCRVEARDEGCAAAPRHETVAVGGVCDTAMQPIAGVP
jgi:hypothetical protein